MRRFGTPALALFAVWGATGCELSDVALASSEDLLIAEVFIESDEGPGRAYAFVHRTIGAEVEPSVPGVDITLSGPGGSVTLLETDGPEECLVETSALLVAGTCYRLDTLPDGFAGPGDRVEIMIRTLDGRTLRGSTTLPEDLSLQLPAPGVGECLLAPDTSFAVRWSEAAGTWAYVGDVFIEGLADVMAERGIDAELREDPLHLIGLAISSADTSLVFPSEFGVFDRIHLDREIALLIQPGLPSGTSASVTIAATDRNYVNWVRGGSFNPSGSIRIPSLDGDGTGVFASMVTRTFRVLTDGSAGTPSCDPEAP
jgi:hypothetical protein